MERPGHEENECRGREKPAKIRQDEKQHTFARDQIEKKDRVHAEDYTTRTAEKDAARTMRTQQQPTAKPDAKDTDTVHEDPYA